MYSAVQNTIQGLKLPTSNKSNNATWLSMIWNTPPTHSRRPSNEPSTTPLSNLTTKFDNQRNRFALGRRGFLLVLFLLFLGLRDLLLRSSHHPTAAKDPSKIRIKGRDPFLVLKEFTPAFVHPLGALLPFDKLWKSDHQSGQEDDAVLGAGDTTAIVLNWKRTENVVVIVASLCQYAFFETVLVWNNNPQLYLTREVSSFLSRTTTSQLEKIDLGRCEMSRIKVADLQLAAESLLLRPLPRLRPSVHSKLFLPGRRLARPTSPSALFSVRQGSRRTSCGAYESKRRESVRMGVVFLQSVVRSPSRIIR